jgi:hypothetical protein
MVARVLIIALLALAACKKQSELYCEMHPGDFEHCSYLDAAADARPTCGGDPDCTPAAPYCEPNAHFCVECYLPDQCAQNAIEKFCDLSTFSCTSCVKNADCVPSNVCLPNGVCGDDGNVAYVDPAMGTDNADCTSAMPCDTVAAALATKKPNIKLTGTIDEAVAIASRAVTLIADPGTTLRDNGVVLSITKGADVSIYDLTIVGSGEKGIAADMNSTVRLTRVQVTGCNAKDKRAVEVKNSTLLMNRCTIFSNQGGGVLVDAGSIYQITNSFIYRNGKDDSMVGGLSLLPTSSVFNKLEMNTIADNRATATAAGGVNCQTNIAAPNNLIVRNYAGGHAGLPTDNTGIPACDFAQSIRATDVPDFAFVTPDGEGPWDYHVTAGSMAIDRGVASDITNDVDGDSRPQGAQVDVGADEFKL